MKNRAIIYLGNGFDLACDFKTSYNDFIQSEEFKSIEKTNTLAQYINQIYKEENWSDVEEMLFCYSKYLIEQYGECNLEVNSKFEKEFNDLSLCLQKYIAEALHTENFPKNMDKVLMSWKECFSIKQICCFNYSPMAVTLGLLNDDSSLHYIHGSVKPQGEWNATYIKITLGIDSTKQTVSPVHKFLYKKENPNTKSLYWCELTQIQKKRVEKLGYEDKTWFDGVEYIVFYGCSFGESDYAYFDYALKNNRKRAIIIYHHNDKQKIIERIKNIDPQFPISKIIFIDNSINSGFIDNLRVFLTNQQIPINTFPHERY